MKPAEVAAGIEYLRRRDPILGAIIERVGGFVLKREPDIFTALVRAIISQQISTGAARSIYQRLCDRVGGEKKLLKGLAGMNLDELRAVGVSPQKAGYLIDLATKVSSGTVTLDQMGELSNEQIVEELTQVKGIGVWTVQMLLIFSLGRLECFPKEISESERRFSGCIEGGPCRPSRRICESTRSFGNRTRA